MRCWGSFRSRFGFNLVGLGDDVEAVGQCQVCEEAVRVVMPLAASCHIKLSFLERL